MTLAPPLYGELTSFFLPKALILDDYVFGPSDEPLLASLRELVQRAKDGWRIAPHDRADDLACARSRARASRRHADRPGDGGVGAARRAGPARGRTGPRRGACRATRPASRACSSCCRFPAGSSATEQGVQLTGRGRVCRTDSGLVRRHRVVPANVRRPAHAAVRQPAHSARRPERDRDDGEPRDERVGQRRRAQDLFQEAR